MLFKTIYCVNGLTHHENQHHDMILDWHDKKTITLGLDLYLMLILNHFPIEQM